MRHVPRPSAATVVPSAKRNDRHRRVACGHQPRITRPKAVGQRDEPSADRRTMSRAMAPLDSSNPLPRRVVRAACPHDCPDTCAMLVTVENGQRDRRHAVRPIIRRPAARCARRSRAISTAPIRPIACCYPMKRVGRERRRPLRAHLAGTRRSTRSPRRFKAIAASPDGPQAILPYSYAGTMGLLQGIVDGPTVLPSARRVAARPHDLRCRAASAGWARRHRRVDRHGRRGSTTTAS